MTAALLAGLAAWVAVAPPAGLRRVPSRRPEAGWPAVTALVGGIGLAAGAPRQTLLALVLVASAFMVRRVWRERRLAREVVATRELVVECCDLLAAELTAGQPPTAALARAAEAWPAMAMVAQTQSYGGDVPSALRRVAASPGAEGLAVVAAAWQVSHRTGLGLADALARVAGALRDARATDRVVRSELASARATARLVAVLPVPALAIGAGSGGDPLGFLIGTPLGLGCLAVGLGLGLAGLAWIERIAAGVGR